jgi:tRNA C32,U32 (ribose-2'-O)-methylase TrmJ
MGSGPVALVFGPERDGLTNEEITRCHHLIHVPAYPSYPALNLAQAVAICVYELRCAWLERQVPATVQFRRPSPSRNACSTLCGWPSKRFIFCMDRRRIL